MDDQGITCEVSTSLLVCFEVGWLRVGGDVAHSLRDKLGFPCTAQMQRQKL